MNVDAYLNRIGIAPASVDTPDRATLERLQRAHVRTVPFENLSIVGDPHDDREGPGVSLSVPHLYEKIVERKRGGYCFELNGLFHVLLDALGYRVDRCAARMVSALDTPANHHVNLVHLERRYVVDVGTGPPMLRTPLPLDGPPCTDEAGVDWRMVEPPRPDAAYREEFRPPGATDWESRFVFTPTPRALSYFNAANDYLQSAPESPFTGAPIVARSTPPGYITLSMDVLRERRGVDRREHSVPASAWHDTLHREFGLQVPAA